MSRSLTYESLVFAVAMQLIMSLNLSLLLLIVTASIDAAHSHDTNPYVNDHHQYHHHGHREMLSNGLGITPPMG